jgi:hypothetical protein
MLLTSSVGGSTNLGIGGGVYSSSSGGGSLNVGLRGRSLSSGGGSLNAGRGGAPSFELAAVLVGNGGGGRTRGEGAFAWFEIGGGGGGAINDFEPPVLSASCGVSCLGKLGGDGSGGDLILESDGFRAACWAASSCFASAPIEILLLLSLMSTGAVRFLTGTLRSDSCFFFAIVGGRISS